MDTIELNETHQPTEKAISAFKTVEGEIKAAIIKSRHHWDKHEPRMWARAAGIDDDNLVSFEIPQDLVSVRSGVVAYGTIVFGKIRIPATKKDDDAAGFVHVRCVDAKCIYALDCDIHETKSIGWILFRETQFVSLISSK